MRRLATADRIREFLRALGRQARQPARAYLAGGATAVLLGWRDATIDIDLTLAGPGEEQLLRAIPALKEQLEVNVELATPAHFLPLPAGWEEHSRFEVQEGRLTVYHVGFVWQALAKLHPGHGRRPGWVAAQGVKAGIPARSRPSAEGRPQYDRLKPHERRSRAQGLLPGPSSSSR